MALIKCSECGKEISDKAVACPACGCPINKTEQDLLTNEKKQKSNKSLDVIQKILLIICKLFFVAAIYGELSSILGYTDVPILVVSSLLLMVEFLLLLFAFPKYTTGIKITSLMLTVTEILYAVGMVFFSTTIKGSILLPIMCVTNAVVWVAIALKLLGKPLPFFEKTKFLYVLLPLLKPILFLIIKFDLSGILLWTYTAIACAFVGYFVGYNKIKTDYTNEENTIQRNNTIAGVLLVLFFPVGVILLWKNKCFTKAKRIIGTILSAIWFPFFCLLLIGALVPCEHNWVGGSCTEVAVCDICGEEAEKPNGHVTGEWSEWKTDYDEAKNTREKVCSVCEEVVDTESEDVTSFVKSNCFTIYPSAFASRFEDSSSRLKDIDYYAKSEPKFDSYVYDEDNLIYYRIQDKNDDYSDVGLMSFSDGDNKTLSVMDNYSENKIEYINILIEKSSDVSAVVYSSILAIDPSIDYDKAADVGQEVVDNIAIRVGEIDEKDFQGITYNGINYLLYRDREYHYIIISVASSTDKIESTTEAETKEDEKPQQTNTEETTKKEVNQATCNHQWVENNYGNAYCSICSKGYEANVSISATNLPYSSDVTNFTLSSISVVNTEAAVEDGEIVIYVELELTCTGDEYETEHFDYNVYNSSGNVVDSGFTSPMVGLSGQTIIVSFPDNDSYTIEFI